MVKCYLPHPLCPPLLGGEGEERKKRGFASLGHSVGVEEACLRTSLSVGGGNRIKPL